jgi:hypothetical protein
MPRSTQRQITSRRPDAEAIMYHTVLSVNCSAAQWLPFVTSGV